jgi:hypothetical protein
MTLPTIPAQSSALAALFSSPAAWWKLAGDNIPGWRILTIISPRQGRGKIYHKYRSSYSAPLNFNNSMYSS